MKLKSISQKVSNRVFGYINERKGWKTDRKIVVIESDDWGAIRMPDRETYDTMLRAGIRVDKSHYNKFDTLAGSEDFGHLYQILCKYRDMKGNHPVITANTVVANPDFGRIEQSEFTKYYYEPFTQTLSHYNRDFKLWKEGIDRKLFYPQFHAREHLNVYRWINYLRRNSREVRFAFKHKLYGIGSKLSLEGNPSFVQAFDSNDYLPNHTLKDIINDGLQIFLNTFGYQSKSFIAPNYIWGDEVENLLHLNGVKFIQGSTIQKKVNGTQYNYTGKRNYNNQIYLVRNVVFEPSTFVSQDWVNSSIKEIAQAFKLRRPAVICTHRVNYIGMIFENNRIKNLKLLDELLSKILKNWPDIEFMTSEELGYIIEQEGINLEP